MSGPVYTLYLSLNQYLKTIWYQNYQKVFYFSKYSNLQIWMLLTKPVIVVQVYFTWKYDNRLFMNYFSPCGQGFPTEPYAGNACLFSMDFMTYNTITKAICSKLSSTMNWAEVFHFILFISCPIVWFMWFKLKLNRKQKKWKHWWYHPFIMHYITKFTCIMYNCQKCNYK